MPTQPIVEYHPKGDDSTDKLAKVMMMEKLGSGIAGASEMLNKGIESYQRIKAQKQTQDLAAITAAGVMVGGLDRLPIETRNKLPGILNVDLPRDDKGNVMLTPSAQDIVNRSIEKAAELDPITFGKVKGGMQTASRPPEEVALDQEKEITTRQGKVLEYKTKEAERIAAEAKDKADRADAEERNVRDNQTKIDVAKLRGPTAASARAEHKLAPSDFWVNKETGETLSKKAVEIKLKEGENIEDKWYNPTNEGLEQHIAARKAQAQVDRARSNNELDKTRSKYMESRMQIIAAKDPTKLKFIMDELREAQAVLSKGGPAAKEAEQVIDYWNKELITALGVEASPENYEWMKGYLDVAKGAGFALLENMTGRGSEKNTPPGPAPGLTSTGSAATAAKSPASLGGEAVEDPELEALMAPFRK